MRVMPDLQYIGKKLLVSKGQEELNKLLNKVLDRKDDSSHSGQETSPGEQAPGDEKSPERQLIEGVLDTIFH